MLRCDQAVGVVAANNLAPDREPSRELGLEGRYPKLAARRSRWRPLRRCAKEMLDTLPPAELDYRDEEKCDIRVQSTVRPVIFPDIPRASADVAPLSDRRLVVCQNCCRRLVY